MESLCTNVQKIGLQNVEIHPGSWISFLLELAILQRVSKTKASRNEEIWKKILMYLQICVWQENQCYVWSSFSCWFHLGFCFQGHDRATPSFVYVTKLVQRASSTLPQLCLREFWNPLNLSLGSLWKISEYRFTVTVLMVIGIKVAKIMRWNMRKGIKSKQFDICLGFLNCRCPWNRGWKLE